jgi:aryl-alcohol dehydrogenase-like predicted oxidoreductase
MRYNTYLKDSIQISEIGLGAWQLGINSGWKSISEKEAVEMVQYAIDKGINFFDTAPNYGNGSSELRLGKGLQGIDRASYVINTKFGHTDTGEINYNSDYIRKSLEGSLKRLKTDYVDSLIIHSPPAHYLDGSINDQFQILDDLKSEGLIKAYGASIDTAEEIKTLLESTGSKVVEAFFNIFHQNSANAFETARKKGVRIIAKIPFDSGWLTGKYHHDSTFEGIRSRWSKKDISTRARLVNELKELTGNNVDLIRLALSFCLSFEEVSTVIPGNTSIDQLKKNIESIEHPIPETLKDDLMKFYNQNVQHLNLPW